MDHTRHGHGGPLSEGLPERERADHEVAAGAIAGLAGGAAMWLIAMLAARGDGGFSYPLRLVAASFLGHGALDTRLDLGTVFLGALLVGLTSVVFGLVYTSILPETLDVMGAVLVGLVFAATVWLITWFGLVRVVDPILYIGAHAGHMLGLYGIYGLVLGVLVPFLRKVLP